MIRNRIRTLLLALCVAAPTPPALARQRPVALSTDLKALYAHGVALYQAGRYQEGFSVAQAYAAATLRRNGPQSYPFALALSLKSSFEEALNLLPDAAKDLRAALPVTEKVLGARHEVVLSAKVQLSGIDQDLARYDEAEQLLTSVLATETALYGPDDPRLVEALSGMIELAPKTSRFAEAEAYGARALSILDKSAHPDPDSLVTVLNNLGVVYQGTRKSADAEKTYLRALAVEENTAGPDAVPVAKILINVDVFYAGVGRYPEAEQAAKRALEIFEKRLGPDDPAIAQVLSNLASDYDEQDRLPEAERALDRALAIQEKSADANRQILAGTLNNFGGLLRKEGRPAEAEPIFSRAIEIMTQTSGADNPLIARMLTNLASALADEGRTDEARKKFEQALAMTEKAYGADSPETALTLDNMARLAITLGHPDEAEALARRATANAGRAILPDRSTLAATLKRQGLAARLQGRAADAEALYTQALSIIESTFGAGTPRSIDVLDGLAAVAASRNDWDHALELQRRAADIALRAVAGGPNSVDPQSDLAVAARNLAIADWQVAVTHPDQDATLAEEAFVAAQNSELSSAASAVTQMAARFGAGDDAIAKEVREQQDLAAQAKALNSALDAQLGAAGNGDRAAFAALRAQISAVQAKLADATARIQRDFPAYAELSNPKPLTIPEVQALLRPDEALVSWLVSDQESLVWAITGEGSTWRRIDLGTSALDAAVAKLRASLDIDKVTSAIAAGKPGRDAVFDLRAAHTLYTQILEPVQELLVGKTTLVAVPAGALTSLPLQVLVTQAPKRAGTSLTDPIYQESAWLARRFAVTVMPSVTALRGLRQFAKPTAAPKPLIGFADPVFSSDAGQGQTRGPTGAPASVEAYGHYFRGRCGRCRGLAARPAGLAGNGRRIARGGPPSVGAEPGSRNRRRRDRHGRQDFAA